MKGLFSDLRRSLTQKTRHDEDQDGDKVTEMAEKNREESLVDRQRWMSDNWDGETNIDVDQRKTVGKLWFAHANIHSGGIKFHFVFVSPAESDEWEQAAE